MTIELRALNGVRNDISPERYSTNDLVEAINVDIDETGKVYRRLSTQLLTAGAMHSLHSFTNTAIVVNGQNLCSVTSAGALTTLATGIADRLGVCEINGDVYWTDTAQTGVIEAGLNHRWGVEPPLQPGVTAGVGDMLAGTYLVSATYIRADGHESGAAPYAKAVLNAHSSLTVSVAASADPFVTRKRIYVTAPNGELPYLVAEVTNATATVPITALPNLPLPLRTMNLGPAPAGQLVGYYNGRAYIGSGRFLWYSQPYEFELFDWTSGFIAFDSNVKTFAAVTSGIYIGTENETMYLGGSDPSEFVRAQVAAYGTVLGTEYYVRNDLLFKDGVPGVTPVWMSKTGLCLGMDNGEMQNLTSSKFIVQSMAEGASLMKIRSGTPQLVTTLYS